MREAGVVMRERQVGREREAGVVVRETGGGCENVLVVHIGMAW